jgi:nucleotide-binding universal stress UspA family protein
MKTNTMKTLLIALDYDPTAKKIAEEGFLLAKAMSAEVILLHVIADSTYYSALQYSPVFGFLSFSDSDWSHLLEADGLKNATSHFLNKVKQQLGDETIQTMVKEGDFAESISKAAKDLHADIIVMGSHSRRWLDEILMGSVTGKVLQHTSIPLFIIPTKKHK